MEGTNLSRHVGTRVDGGAAQSFSPTKFVSFIKYKPMTCTFPILIFNFLTFVMFSICCKLKGSSSGR